MKSLKENALAWKHRDWRNMNRAKSRACPAIAFDDGGSSGRGEAVNRIDPIQAFSLFQFNMEIGILGSGGYMLISKPFSTFSICKEAIRKGAF
jgi:hypothetical protein